MQELTDSGHHGMDGGEVSLACRATVNAFTRKISTVAHAHGGSCMKGEKQSMEALDSNMKGKGRNDEITRKHFILDRSCPNIHKRDLLSNIMQS